MEIKLSAIVITKNEESKLYDCLESLSFADEIVVVDNGSEDNTILIAKKFTQKIYKLSKGGFSQLRNKGLEESIGDWVIYVDADERVTPELRNEIQRNIENTNSSFTCFAIPRKNIIFGKEMVHGGWWPDYVKRLFKKDTLTRWVNELHEEPEYKGSMGHLRESLLHLKHDSLSEMVEKTNRWSEIEAKLLFESRHPKMSWWRFIRIMLSELWLRLIIKKGFLDGIEGVIYTFYQMWSRFITYGKLWEKQKLSD